MYSTSAVCFVCVLSELARSECADGVEAGMALVITGAGIGTEVAAVGLNKGNKGVSLIDAVATGTVASFSWCRASGEAGCAALES